MNLPLLLPIANYNSQKMVTICQANQDASGSSIKLQITINFGFNEILMRSAVRGQASILDTCQHGTLNYKVIQGQNVSEIGIFSANL